MKVFLLNGSPHPRGCTYTALEEIAKTLEENGVSARIEQLGTDALRGCTACAACVQDGKCVFDDKVNALAPEMLSADGLIFGTPVHYAAPAGALTSFLDRFFFTYGKKLAGKPAAGVVSCRRGGATAAFDQLNKYFALSSMPIVTSQYWNMIHGAKREDAGQDGEGLQTMRTLARNFVWLLKCIEAGKAKGIVFPEREAPIRTNFIR